MEYSFKDMYSRSKVAVETDRYVIYQMLKSKLNFSGNYLLIKQMPEIVDELEYYIASCYKFFKDAGINFIHIAIPEKKELSKKLKKYLKKDGYNEINFDLYHLKREEFVEQNLSNYKIEFLQKKNNSEYLEFQYKIDSELGDNSWAIHNQELLYENIRSENILQLIAKDNDKIIGTMNVIMKTDFFEVDNLYVAKKYRRQGVAKHLLNYAVLNMRKENVVLVADSNDTPKYMYEKLGFKKISKQDFYLKSNIN
ncbi:acetyltransferase, GNAT family [Gemella bergeri ATCC 700627]|uniref:Acetyltransferase, GNAT family n=1 Tax=Gemella bergeri ATCC 700627 TaxID=1321820 RepID=U2RZR1_9BACL|nr:GNAT family N-acetyltransferase [Gemella bergeri]ERK56087.1 acetyltransferase, GNAT family [Gemella bergeri ATCC 700627]